MATDYVRMGKYRDEGGTWLLERLAQTIQPSGRMPSFRRRRLGETKWEELRSDEFLRLLNPPDDEPTAEMNKPEPGSTWESPAFGPGSRTP